MTVYMCRRGCKVDIPEEKCENEDLVRLSNNPIRAFCAFCAQKDKVLIFYESGPKFGTACDFIRADLSWDDFQEREE